MTSESTNDPQREFALQVARSLHQNGFIAYFAGGCVRDQVMGNTPHDYDIATDARPDQVREIFGSRNTLLVGASFGVVCVHGRIGHSKEQVEVATFRSDGPYSNGRHPDSISFATPEMDAQRRDFTINGLFYDPHSDQLIDYVGGIADIRSRILRAIGQPEHRFGEDKLRLLRAVRFAARFQLTLDSNTEQAIRSLADSLKVVSAERIAAEIRKIAELDGHANALTLLQRTGLMRPIFNDLHELWKEHPERLQSSLSILESLRTRSLSTFVSSWMIPALGTLELEADDRNRKEMQSSFGQRLGIRLKEWWKISNEEASAIEYLLDSVRAWKLAKSMSWSQLQPMVIDSRIDLLRSLIDALATGDSVFAEALRRIDEALSWPVDRRDPKPLLDGQDLHRAGLRPGPQYSELLKSIRQKQLDGQVADRQAALAWLQQQANPTHE